MANGVTVIPSAAAPFFENFASSFIQAQTERRRLEIQQQEQDRLARNAEFQRGLLTVDLAAKLLEPGQTFADLPPAFRKPIEDAFGAGTYEQIANMPVTPQTWATMLDQQTRKWATENPDEMPLLAQRHGIRTATGLDVGASGLTAQESYEQFQDVGFKAIMEQPEFKELAYTSARLRAGLAEEMEIRGLNGEVIGTADTEFGANMLWNTYKWQQEMMVGDPGEALKFRQQAASTMTKQLADLGYPTNELVVMALMDAKDMTVKVDGRDVNALEYMYATQPELRPAISMITGTFVTLAGAAELAVTTDPDPFMKNNLSAIMLLDRMGLEASAKIPMAESFIDYMSQRHPGFMRGSLSSGQRGGWFDSEPGFHFEESGGGQGLIGGLWNTIRGRSPERGDRQSFSGGGQPAQGEGGVLSADQQRTARVQIYREALDQGFTREQLLQRGIPEDELDAAIGGGNGKRTVIDVGGVTIDPQAIQGAASGIVGAYAKSARIIAKTLGTTVTALSPVGVRQVEAAVPGQRPKGRTTASPRVSRSGGSFKFGVTDPDLAFIIQRESSWNPRALNRQGTIKPFGLGQLIEANRVAIGARLGIDPETTNPQEQIKMMEAYVKERYGTPARARAHKEATADPRHPQYQPGGWY